MMRVCSMAAVAHAIRPSLSPLRRSRHITACADGGDFAELGLSPQLQSAVQSMGFQRPMAVQRAAFDAVLGGEDAVLLSETGSGKTLAYALPILHRLLAARAAAPPPMNVDEGPTGGRLRGTLRRGGRPDDQVLVLVPNRDLCAQVHATFASLLSSLAVQPPSALPPLSASSLGSEFDGDVDADVLIATPALALRAWRGPGPFRVVVLDEVDALLAGSFKPAARAGYPIEMLVAAVKRSAKLEALEAGATEPRPRRSGRPAGQPREGTGSARGERAALHCSKQFVLVGATMPNAGTRNVETHVRRLFPLARWHTAARVHRDAERLQQYFVKVDESSRGEALRSALRHGPSGPTLIFANTVELALKAAEHAADEVGRGGVGVFHGGVLPLGRAQLLTDFNAGRLGTLVCTGLAARGLDFVGVSHVVQFTVATNAVEFMHRIGRTARAGNAGTATTLYTADRAALVEGLRDALAAGEPVEHLFSRKRSLALGIKKRKQRAGSLPERA